MKIKTTLTILSSVVVSLPLFGGRASDSYTVEAEGLLPQTSFAAGSYVLEGTLAPVSGGSSDSYTLLAGVNPGSNAFISTPKIESDLMLEEPLLEGETLVLEVVMNGPGPFTYSWTKDGEEISTEAILEIAGVTNDDEGDYAVTVTNPFSEVNSLTASLEVIAIPVITTDLAAEVEDIEGNTLTYSIEAIVEGTPAYQWSKDGEAIEGATESSLELADLAGSDEGVYTVEVSNEAGSVTSIESTLSVIEMPVILTDLDAEVEGLEGTTYTYTIEADVEGTPAYQWSKDGEAIEGATEATLELAGLTGSDEGVYSVEVSNEAGSVTSVDSTLSVLEIPVIVTDVPAAVEAIEGETVTLTVEATVEGTPGYQWMKDGVAIDGASATSLELTGVTGADEGVYSVEVSNEAGSVMSSDSTLSVIETPVILAQPEDVEGNPRGTASFTVDARTEGTVVYTWFKDGLEILDSDSSTLALSDLGLDDLGAYSVRISNEAGMVMSDAANLTMVAGAIQVPAALAGSEVVSIDDGSITYMSDWFGEFTVEDDGEFGWVYTTPLGWTFFTSISSPEESYIYPLLVGGILYTNDTLYPSYAYSYSDASFVFIPPFNDAETGSIWLYVYGTDEWKEYSE